MIYSLAVLLRASVQLASPRVGTVIFRLYSGDRVWLIVPECMLASRAATGRYGFLHFLGEIDQDRFSAVELVRISAEFDSDSFAEIPEATAHRLLSTRGRAKGGLGSAGLSPP